MFSRRTDHDARPHPLAEAAERARAEGRALLDLTRSNPTELGLGLDAATVLEPLGDRRALLYEPAPFGRMDARIAAAAAMGADPARTVLTASTSEAYAFVFLTLADPGDRVLVPTPSYPLLEWLAKLAAVELVPYTLAYDGTWYVDRDSVRAALARPARAIVCVSPNHPTGSVLTEDDRDFLLETGVPLVIDEVFAGYPLDRDGVTPHRPATRGLVFRLSGLSKAAALPQMKLGFVALEGAAAWVEEALRRLELVADTFLSVSTPTQLAAPHWLAAAHEARARIAARCRANLASLDRALVEAPMTRLRAEAGWYVVLRLPRVLDEDGYCRTLLDADVVVHPGWYYDLPDPPCLVLSLLPPEEDFAEALRRLRRVVDAACAPGSGSLAGP